jgi:hypothetical protein
MMSRQAGIPYRKVNEKSPAFSSRVRPGLAVGQPRCVSPHRFVAANATTKKFEKKICASNGAVEDFYYQESSRS